MQLHAVPVFAPLPPEVVIGRVIYFGSCIFLSKQVWPKNIDFFFEIFSRDPEKRTVFGKQQPGRRFSQPRPLVPYTRSKSTDPDEMSHMFAYPGMES